MPKPAVPGDQLLLPSLSPGPTQLRLAAGIVLALVVAAALAYPNAEQPFPAGTVLLPAYAAVVLTTEAITAALLFAQFSTQRSPALLVLAVGYLFTGLMIVPWALTFPGVFAPDGLLGANLQSTAAIAALRRVGFPLFVLAYALMKDRVPETNAGSRPVVLAAVAATLAAILAATAVAVEVPSVLPRFMVSTSQTTELWDVVPAVALVLCGAGLAAFAWRWRRRSVLDLWLVVVLCAWAIESFLLGFAGGGRFSVGWWAGRSYGLAASCVVLVVLMAEITTLYARIVRSMAAERCVREAKLASLEALSAAIAHEVNQPLASMVTNAEAGLRWLNRPVPDLGEAREALACIAKDGHRAARVIEGIRAAFRKSPQARVPLDINAIVQDTLKHARGDLRANRVSVFAEFDETLPWVNGNPVQLQQVVLNLVANAVDAMGAVTDRARVLRLRSARQGTGSVLVVVEDSGTGLEPTQEERLFEPFFTTKPNGSGMGLTICQSIIEAHGGRLWTTGNRPHGAVFQFTLPIDQEFAQERAGDDARNNAWDRAAPATERAQ
ncbi:MASE4 domain-containing protein [Azospirillum rugosum]|uniref:histidine kinase n=1 Tax=Azospirillum rugosum TaxID=416170 RepID=A0ABS4SFW9_9PROT|nr:MASE4 domain-containing protein [Azospirillum rugosum]MBP2291463.1 signal transduction histidine kinase [Azospirillum rugosum]MDQ0525251.1 signal transduction histidine kinase [Azospirillum rugosum]